MSIRVFKNLDKFLIFTCLNLWENYTKLTKSFNKERGWEKSATISYIP